MDSTSISLLACIFSFLAVLTVWRVKRKRPQPTSDDAYGDWPHVSPDFSVGPRAFELNHSCGGKR